MATLFYCVWTSAGSVANGDPVDENLVNIDVTSTQSAAISGHTRENQRMRVRLYADTDCYVTWGANPTALTDGTEGRPFGADNPEYVDIQAGHKIATILRT